MYVPRGQFGARAHYKSVDLASRIEGASPHQLVQVMFEELLKSMDAMLVAARRNDYGQRGQCQSRALSILSALETSLDYEKGGEIATGLAVIYREARRLLVIGGRGDNPQAIASAREMIGEISGAWDAIGRRG